jgi:glycosyltransferase involved in cell wall biosynthesis
MNPVSRPIFSVIICTANRPILLLQCVASVMAQSVPADVYEIVIVNNTPETDLEMRGIVSGFGRDKSIIYVVEPESGLSHARNRGISVARGRIFVFIDDDATADTTWLEEIQRTYTEFPSAACVGGRISLVWEGGVPQWLHRDLHGCLGELDYGDGVLPIQRDQRLGGGHFSIQRAWLESCGDFSPRLGRDQKSLLSGEENELLIRVWDQGGECYYNGRSLVLHPAPLHRMKRSFFRQRVYWGGRSIARIERIHAPQSICGSLLGRLTRLPYHWLRSLWFRVTGHQRLAFLWETYCWDTLGYCTEMMGIPFRSN